MVAGRELASPQADDVADRPGGRGPRVGAMVAGLAVLLAASILVAIGLGAASVSPVDTASFLWAAISGGEIDADQVSRYQIVWQIRTPRVLLAAVVGAGLSTVGVVIQALVRNALADPFVLGVSSGASVGAVAVIVTGSLAAAGIHAVSLGAFLGALVASVAVYGLARGRTGTSPLRLVLVGVALAYGFQAAMGLLVYLVPQGEATGTVLFWTLGSFGAAMWGSLPLVAVAVLVCLAWSWRRARSLDLLALGDETAMSTGVDPSALRRELFVLTAVATGAMVAVSGAIGFIGLVMPHVVRLVVGVGHARVLLVAPLAGAVFTVWVDLLARTVVAPRDLPLGVITALVGVPVFVLLIRRRGYVYGTR